jgi:hypothetical protein
VGVLAPGALAVGAALALVILAIYLLKPRRPLRQVSSTFLWLATIQTLQSRPVRRVPPNILLVLQLLALAALVLALARPFVSSPEAAGTDAIVLLDVSASMQATDVAGGPSRFEVARERVRAIIDNLQPEQALTLISLGAEARVIAPRTGDRGLLRTALAGMQPTTRPANLSAGLSLAGSLAEGHPDAQVIVVGDGSLDRSQVPASLPVPVRFVPIGSPAENLAIAALGTRVIDGKLGALASVANYGSQRQVATVELRLDGARFDATTVSVEPGGAAQAQWVDLPGATRVLEARLLEPDAMALDNAAWAVVGGERPTRVLLVSNSNVFLERALALRPGVQITRRVPGRYVDEPGQPFDLVVFDGFLPERLPDRGGLFILHPPVDNALVPTHEDVPVSALNVAHEDDALLSDVPLQGIHVNRSRRLETPAWADTLLAAPETPALLVGERGGQR